MSEFREGDVVRYQPDARDGSGDRWWCREGMAVAVLNGIDLRLVDTYWRSGGDTDSHRLTPTEVRTAEVVFNVNDFEVVQHKWRWAEYAAADRAFIQSQHNLQHVWMVRRGAEPDPGTRVSNAQEAFMKAVDEATSASRSVEYAKRELDRVITEALIESDEAIAVGDR